MTINNTYCVEINVEIEAVSEQAAIEKVKDILRDREAKFLSLIVEDRAVKIISSGTNENYSSDSNNVISLELFKLLKYKWNQ